MTAAILAVLSVSVLLLWREIRSLNRRLLDQRARMDVIDVHINANAVIRKTITETVLNLGRTVLQVEARVEKAEKQWGPCQ